MARENKKISAAPLFERLDKTKGAAAQFAEDLNISEQRVSNWRRRGIPAAELPRIAAAIGMTSEQYLAEAGYPNVPRVEQPAAADYAVDRTLREDFLALPGGLRQYVLRKTAELRAYADGLPSFIRETIKAPPADPDGYRSWQLELEADMTKRRIEEEAVPTPPPSPARTPGAAQTRKGKRQER